jgi:hypothetical protein
MEEERGMRWSGYGASMAQTRVVGAGGVVLAATLGVSLAACRPPVSTLRSNANLEGAKPITQLVVYSDIEGPAVTHVASTAFEAGIVRRLNACGVEARVVSADRMDPTPPDARIGPVLAQLQTGAVMIVKATGGELKPSTNLLQVKLALTDVETHETTWAADASAYFSTGDAAAADGAKFATLLVTRLRDDGVLTHCKPGEAYPGCFDDLRRALAARQRASSLGQPDAAEFMPSCNVPPSGAR